MTAFSSSTVRVPVTDPSSQDVDIEALNDRLAREHPVDEYYSRAPWPIRLVERRRLDIIRSFTGEVAGMDVAEVGSGGGHVLKMFAEARLTAIDVSGVFLEQARRNLAGLDVRFLKGEVEKLALPPASFDRIICTEVLEHTLDPEAVLSEIARLLRPDGFAVVTVPNHDLIVRVKYFTRRKPARWFLGRRIDWTSDDFHLHHWAPAEFESLLKRHLNVLERRSAPVNAIPLRICFKCRPCRMARFEQGSAG
jgi:2-polyprenyl-3-methyl-5-hydroxy-6-metoxy-1,4-benzoquinol methylase